MSGLWWIRSGAHSSVAPALDHAPLNTTVITGGTADARASTAILLALGSQTCLKHVFTAQKHEQQPMPPNRRAPENPTLLLLTRPRTQTSSRFLRTSSSSLNRASLRKTRWPRASRSLPMRRLQHWRPKIADSFPSWFFARFE